MKLQDLEKITELAKKRAGIQRDIETLLAEEHLHVEGRRFSLDIAGVGPAFGEIRAAVEKVLTRFRDEVDLQLVDLGVEP